MSTIKTMTIDGYYTAEQANNLTAATWDLPFQTTEFGDEIQNFNMVAADADAVFSQVLHKPVQVDLKTSGIFRRPRLFVHFESFTTPGDWIFVVAVQPSMFNIYHHASGAKSALDGYNFDYRMMFGWDLTVSYLLEPGQGVFFRPWQFHSFDTGLIQTFRMTETDFITDAAQVDKSETTETAAEPETKTPKPINKTKRSKTKG
jgi:hypothetical protein